MRYSRAIRMHNASGCGSDPLTLSQPCSVQMHSGTKIKKNMDNYGSMQSQKCSKIVHRHYGGWAVGNIHTLKCLKEVDAKKGESGYTGTMAIRRETTNTAPFT